MIEPVNLQNSTEILKLILRRTLELTEDCGIVEEAGIDSCFTQVRTPSGVLYTIHVSEADDHEEEQDATDNG